MSQTNDGYKWPLGFSDEELRLMKQELTVNDHDKMIWKNVELRALLHRLEAAENVCVSVKRFKDCQFKALREEMFAAWDAWRKATGK